MISALVFDFDGVIVDTEPLHYRAFQVVLDRYSLAYPWQEYLDVYLGFDDRDALRERFRRAGRPLDGDKLKQLVAEKSAAFLRLVADGEVKPYPGVVTLLRDTAGKAPLALCSGALRTDVEPILRQLDVRGLFDVMVTADEVARSKPDPESYRLVLERLRASDAGRGRPAGSPVAVEDTPAGIAAAAGAGLATIAVTNSYPADKLSGADLVLDTLEGITLAHLDRMLNSRPR